VCLAFGIGTGIGFALALALLAQLANTRCDLCDAGVIHDNGAVVIIVVADVVVPGWRRTRTLDAATGAGACALWP